MPRDVCGLLRHANRVISVMADNVLDLVVDHDEANERAMDADRKLARKAMKTDEDDEEEDYSQLKGSLSKMVRETRFKMHNQEWLDVVAQEELDDMQSLDEEPSFASPGASPVDPYGDRYQHTYSPEASSAEDSDTSFD